MATLEDISDALRNAHAAGDTASAQKLAAAYVAMQGQSQAAPQPVPSALKVSSPGQNWSNIGAENLDQAGVQPTLTNSERSTGRLMASLPFNVGDEFMAQAASNPMLHRYTNDAKPYGEALTQARDIQSRYSGQHPVESVAIGIPGNVAASSVLPGGPMAQAAESGFAQGFGGGDGGTLNRAGNGALGAATGVATAGVLRGVGKALSQPKVNPDVQLLKNEGVNLTPGQIGGKLAKKTEDIATSVPVMGDFIAKRQNESIEGLNKAVANRALREINQRLPDNVPAGRATVAHVKKAMTDSYNTTLSGMQAQPDQVFASKLQVGQSLASKLPDDQLTQFDKIIKDEIRDKAAKNGGRLTGDDIKGIESTLTAEIKGYSSGGWNDQKLAGALTEVKHAFRDMITRQNPRLAPKLEATDRAYANYAILRKAGSAVGNDGGVFSPAQLQSAVASADASAGKGNFASGAARMQDLSDAAKNILPSKVPDSGTAKRLVQGGFALSGVPLAMSHPLIAAGVGTGLGAGSALYTTPGQQLARALMMGQRPAAVAGAGKAAKAISPYASTIAALLASQPSN